MGIGKAPRKVPDMSKKIRDIPKRSPERGTFGSNQIKLVQIRSSWFKMVQIGSNQIKVDYVDEINFDKI